MWPLVLGVTLGSAAAANHGYKSSRSWLPRDEVPGAVSAEALVAEASLPKHFDWRNVGGRNLVTADWNQHIPVYCGACWVHGTVSALNDRIKVMRRGDFPDVMLARQVINNCVPDPAGKGPPPGCDGGDSWMIHKYMQEHKIPDESCMPYQAVNMGCSSETVCRNCLPGNGGCFPVKNWTGFGVKTYGNLSGEVAMMKEIYARGPIACSFATDGAFMMNYSENVQKHEGVYVTDQKYTQDDVDHVMEVAGWGETPSGVKYWIIRNSWGTYWGSAGWLKLRRGVNQQLSESECDWAIPTFESLDTVLQGQVLGSYLTGVAPVDASPGVRAQLTAAPLASSQGQAAQARAQAPEEPWRLWSQRPEEPSSVGLQIPSVAALAVALFTGAALQALATRFLAKGPRGAGAPLLG